MMLKAGCRVVAACLVPAGSPHRIFGVDARVHVKPVLISGTVTAGPLQRKRYTVELDREPEVGAGRSFDFKASELTLVGTNGCEDV